MLMFLAKKLLSRLLFPIPLILLLGLLGLVLITKERHARTGRRLLGSSLILLLLLSFRPVANALIHPLEGHYATFGQDPRYTLDTAEVGYVVSLADGLPVEYDLPLTGQMGGQMLTRLVEGVRLYRLCPTSTLVLSGGVGIRNGTPTQELTNYQLAIELGVEPDRLIIESESLDTKDQARLLAPILGNDTFLLVTEASHMPRAMAIFEAQGLKPIPAPTGFREQSFEWRQPWTWFPDATSLQTSERAIYEYLGIIWAKLRGLI